MHSQKHLARTPLQCHAGKTGHREEESALAAENFHLRQALSKILQQPAPVIIQQSIQVLLLFEADISVNIVENFQIKGAGVY